MNISFNAVGHEFLTFSCSDTSGEGYPCTMAGNGSVEVAESGDAICGIITDIRDGSAGVLIRGYHEVAYTGTTTPAVGFAKLVADGTGGVKVDTTNGREFWVLSVDSTNKIIGLYL